MSLKQPNSTIILGARWFLLPQKIKTMGLPPNQKHTLGVAKCHNNYFYSITLFLSCQEFMTKFFIS
jgi:hypothetical protein